MPTIVTKRLADGSYNAYQYAYRGGPLERKAFGLTREKALQALNDLGVAKGTVGWLSFEWEKSPEFQGLSKSSQRAYKLYLGRFREEFSHYDIKLFDLPAIKTDIGEWRDDYANKARTADYMIATISSLFSWASSRGISNAEPTRKIRKLWKTDRSKVIWSKEDLDKLAQHVKPHVMRAVRLAVLTGLRLSDLCKLTWADIRSDHIFIVTAKRKRNAYIPLIPEAKALLEEIGGGEGCVLRNLKGDPWTPDGLSTVFYKGKIKAGIDKHFHDLRGTAATSFKVAGLTNEEIALTMGWSPAYVEDLVATYVDSGAIIQSGIDRLNKPKLSAA